MGSVVSNMYNNVQYMLGCGVYSNRKALTSSESPFRAKALVWKRTRLVTNLYKILDFFLLSYFNSCIRISFLIMISMYLVLPIVTITNSNYGRLKNLNYIFEQMLFIMLS